MVDVLRNDWYIIIKKLTLNINQTSKPLENSFEIKQSMKFLVIKVIQMLISQSLLQCH